MEAPQYCLTRDTTFGSWMIFHPATSAQNGPYKHLEHVLDHIFGDIAYSFELWKTVR